MFHDDSSFHTEPSRSQMNHSEVRRVPRVTIDTQKTAPVPIPVRPLASDQGKQIPPSSPYAFVPDQGNPIPQSPPAFVPVSGNISRPLHSRAKPSGQRRKRLLIITTVISILALCGAIISVWISSRAQTPVTLYQVGVQNVTGYVGGGGIVFPRQQLDLSYPVAERVIAVKVKAGDHVSPNQPLIQLDPSQLNTQISQAANELDAAQAYLNSVSASGSAVAIAQAQQGYKLARDRYNALLAEASSSLVRNGNLISPMGGVVTTVDINAGEVFAADTPLLTIMDESTVVVHVKVPLANLGQVHPGEQAIVTPSALPNETFPGTVSSIIPQADPQTDTFEVWVEVVNTDDTLLPGMSAFVSIQNPTRAIVLPRLAVLDPDHAPVVFVEHNGRAYMRQVHVVSRSMDSIYIDAGLSASEKVVLVGLNTLQNGQAVRVIATEKSF